ncbi:MAG: efflux RND transporter periplasmic adaptor subunit [Acidobacteriota bacterium]
MKKLFLPLILLIILGLVGFRLYQKLGAPDTAAAGPGGPGGPGPMAQRASMLVETAEAQPHLFDSQLDALGELQPQAAVDVMSRISGRLKEVLLQRGDPVAKGDLLAVVDDEDLLQQIVRAQASIAVARAGVSREQANYDNLVLQVERYQALHSEQLISNQDLQNVESQLRASRAQLELAKAQVEQAEASLKELKIQQDQTRVYSPLTGFVGTRYVDPGALVSASVPIVRVLDVSRLKTVVPVTEQMISKVRAGLPAQITVDGVPGQKYDGRITRISPFLDPETRSADVEIEIPNNQGVLKPGMFARVVIAAGAPTKALAIPRDALLTRGDEKGVFLLTSQQTTEYRRIEIGRIQGDFVEVLDGLGEGTQVVTSGAQKLNEGDKVRIG